jgi:glycosyltransferase involved in cell wall biosynthesis
MKQHNKSGTHIVIFIFNMCDGGAQRVTANLANYWADKGRVVTIVTLVPQIMDLFELHSAINRISLGLASESANVLIGLWQNMRRVIALKRVLRQIQPDIALGVMPTANVLLALAAWGLSCTRTIGTEHTHPPQQPLGYLWEFLRRHTYGLLNAVTVLASESKDWVKSNTNAQRVAIIPNAVTWPLLDQEPRIYPPHTPRRILLAAGRLIELKNFNMLIDVFSSLAQKHSEWDLVILGEGSLRASLELQVLKLNLENRVFLPGRAGNIGEWYENADLYVMCSRVEGFGMTLVEAMAYGLAAISFDCDTGPRYIIRHEMDGLLVPPGYLTELTTALDRLMSDDLTRQRLAEKALEVRERFSMERIAGMWEKLFEEISLE